MTTSNIKEMIIYVLSKSKHRTIETYVVKNKVNDEFNKKVETSKILYVLKRLEEDSIVIVDRVSYTKQLSWRLS